MSERPYRVGAIVRATIPATSADAALDKLCEIIRAGLGPDEPPRRYDAAIAAGVAKADDDATMRINESLLHDLEAELRR